MELPKRKSTRLKGYDYSTPGMYFLIICVKDRKQLLGKIVGCGDFDTPKMILSEYGIILDEYINMINKKFSHIKIDKYIIMPNHFHLILNITDYKNGASETAAPYDNETSKCITVNITVMHFFSIPVIGNRKNFSEWTNRTRQGGSPKLYEIQRG